MAQLSVNSWPNITSSHVCMEDGGGNGRIFIFGKRTTKHNEFWKFVDGRFRHLDLGTTLANTCFYSRTAVMGRGGWPWSKCLRHFLPKYWVNIWIKLHCTTLSCTVLHKTWLLSSICAVATPMDPWEIVSIEGKKKSFHGSVEGQINGVEWY